MPILWSYQPSNVLKGVNSFTHVACSVMLTSYFFEHAVQLKAMEVITMVIFILLHVHGVMFPYFFHEYFDYCKTELKVILFTKSICMGLLVYFGHFYTNLCFVAVDFISIHVDYKFLQELNKSHCYYRKYYV